MTTKTTTPPLAGDLAEGTIIRIEGYTRWIVVGKTLGGDVQVRPVGGATSMVRTIYATSKVTLAPNRRGA